MFPNKTRLTAEQQKKLAGAQAGNYSHQLQPTLMASNNVFTIAPYRSRKDLARVSVVTKYDVIGYIASGTYGKVYKVQAKSNGKLYAIKKFKSEKEGGEVLHYTGISQSACREMALCRELSSAKNLTSLHEILLERKSIYMVFEYAEHDLLQIIHFHSHPERKQIPQQTLKSIMWQILDGVSYLHQNFVFHRDLKPANIMVTSDGVVKIGDLGLARRFNDLLQTLYTGDKVVVTIWYRAPELLLGARHYTPAIDMWSVGCIFAELIGLRPIFKGEEAKMDAKKNVPFQANQMQRILEILGTPNQDTWPSIYKYPEYPSLRQFKNYSNNLTLWYQGVGGREQKALDLLFKLLTYDPISRITAMDSLEHDYFGDVVDKENIFHGLTYKYPARRIHTDDNDILNQPKRTTTSGGAQNQQHNDEFFRKKPKV